MHKFAPCKLKLMIAAVCALGIMCVPFSSIAADKQLQKLESLVEQLVQLQKEKRAVVKQWNEDRRVLEAEKELLKSRNQEMQKQQDKRGKRIRKLKKKKKERQDRRKELKRQVEQLKDTTRRLRKHLLNLRPRLPSFLAEKLKSNFRSLKRQDTPISNENLTRSMKACMTIVREALRFNQRFHTVRRILTTPDGDKREMKVMYLGLANAFGVSTGKGHPVACRGVPSEDGWSWSWNKQWVKPIRRAFRVYERQEPASFIDLPLVYNREEE